MKRQLFTIISMLVLLSSCGTSRRLVTSEVVYQSARTEYYKASIPDYARIAVGYQFGPNGELEVIVKNVSDKIMTIDATKSFFVNIDGVSTSYYDPTVRQQSVTAGTSRSTGASVNLGVVAGLLGVGGLAGGLLSGINVGGGNTVSEYETNVITLVESPQISLSPRSVGRMPKTFIVDGFGKSSNSQAYGQYDYSNSPKRFAICISFSLDSGHTFETLITNFYLNSELHVSVKSYGNVNDALRELYTIKPDCLNEQWWTLYLNNAAPVINPVYNGAFLDWK